MPADWSIRLQNLKVLDAEEDGLLSDGDEPYLVAIGFRTRFQTPGSTEVFWGGMLDDEWAEGADDGDVFGIPERMGVLEFKGVEQIGEISFGLGRQPELIGAFVAAFESDATPFSEIRKAMKSVMNALRAELPGVVEQAPGIKFNEPIEPQIKAMLDRMAAAIANVNDRLSPSWTKKVELFAKSWGDTDRLIGVRTLTYAAVDPTFHPELSLPRLIEEPLDLNFHQKGVTYAALGQVTRDRFYLGQPLTEQPPQPTQPVQPPQVRYTAVWEPARTNEIQVYGWTYEDYRKKYDELWPKGWRLKLLQPFVLPGGQVRYTAAWAPSTTNEIQVYGWTYEDYRKKYDELWPKGWRLKLLQPFVLPGGQVRYTAVWTPSTTNEIQVYGWTYEDYRKKYDELWPKGWRLKLLQPFVLPGGQVRYTAVWTPSTTGEFQLYGATYADYRKRYDELWGQGWRLKLLQPFVLPGGQVRYTAVWTPSTTGEFQLYGATYADYRKRYDELWGQGWRLKALQPYVL